MRNFARLICVAFVLVLFVSSFGWAQGTASITGVVTDPTGAVVPDVAVLLQNTSVNVVYKATTNSVGSYLITGVAPGPGYKIAFSRDGFQSVTAVDLYLNVSNTRTQNATLKVGSNLQTVEVSASSEAVTLNTADATVGNNFQVNLVNELPVQMRDSPSALFYQQPGVTSAGSVTGSRDDQTSKTLDGLDVNDMATGDFETIAGNAPVDSVQEFRGTTAGTQASTGQGSGGHFDMVTKSGTNAFHGNVNEYHRDTAMTANSWFNNNSGIGRTPLIRNQFGGNLGGPIKKNKAFFFFDYDGRRDVSPNATTRVIPTATYLQGMIGYHSNDANGTIKYMSSTDVTSHDPSHKGFSQAILSLFNSRYPTTGTSHSLGGNGYNSIGYRFNASAPLNEDIYVGRLDYVLSPKMNLFARFTVSREDSTQSAIQFPGDPKTSPFIDRSHAWVVGHSWAINNNISNNVTWGQTVTDWNFPNTFNPQGVTQTTFGMTSSGTAYIDQPYDSAVNAQSRVYPIPVLRDDFTWTKGRHSIQVGGLFKYLNPNFYAKLNYDEPNIGIGGNLGSLKAAQRPSDFYNADTRYNSSYDAAFTTALGRYASQTSVYNYDAKGAQLTQGSGMHHNYRYYEMEFYAQDAWKVTPNLTLSYGLRWVNYTVPYDKQGEEATPSLDFNTYWGKRLDQSAAGLSGDTSLPFISYSLSGHANGKPGMFDPTRHNFAPHVGFDYVPSFDRKTVISGSAGIDYDREVITALLYQQSQYSYPVQISATDNYGASSGSAAASLTGDTRFAGIDSPITAPIAPVMTNPYTPYVDGNVPYGLGLSTWSTAIDKNFKTPYNIAVTFGLQHEFPKGFLWKINYAGRFGRRLMAQADADQLIDFPDKTSGQKMSEAFSNLETEFRANGEDYSTVTAQPWFENLMINNPYAGELTETQVVAGYFGSLLSIGDFADTIEYLAKYGWLPSNVGMGSQFSEFTYYTNKGFSNYHGLLTTLHKNAGYGLQFDLNYTWSHSIDNVSVNANTVAAGTNGAFICDINRPRECRGPSDFDVAQVFNGNFIYDFPLGRGRAFGANMPLWLEEAVGGWSLSGMPTWRTGYPYNATTNAFIAGYSNNAPAVLTGNINNLKVKVHKDSAGSVWLYKDPAKALASLGAPTGFNIGSRNNLRGPHAFSLDLGIAKIFPLYKDKLNLKFRCDAFNVLNHPVYGIPGSTHLDITQSSADFGQVTTTNTARVLQGSLRIEF